MLYKEPTKIKVESINLTYEGLIPRIQKSFLSKDKEAMQPHIRAFVERAVTFTACPECGGTRLNEAARSSRIRGSTSPTPAPCRSATWPSGCAVWTSRPSRRCWRRCSTPSTRSRRSGWATSRLDRPSGTLSGGEAQRTKMIRHLGSSLTDVTYVFDEPTVGLHPHDIQRMNRIAAAAARQGQHRAGRRAQAGGDRDRRPRRRSRPRRRHRRWRGGVRGHRRGAAGQRHADRAAPGRPGLLEAVGADAVGSAGGARRQRPQPAGRRCRHPARRAGGGDRRGRVGKELTDPRLGVGPGRSGVGRPDPDPWLAAEQPGDVHRTARADPQGVREGQRREAGAVQRQLRGRLPQLQRRRRHLHRPGLHGQRRHDLRGVRGPTVPGGGAGLPARRAQHRRGARPARRRRGRLLRRRRGAHAGRARDPGAA